MKTQKKLGTFLVALGLILAGSFGLSFADSSPLVTPLGIDDFPCGHYLVGARLASDETGKDYLIFFPDTEKEFQIPLLKMDAEQSFRYQGINGFYEVNLPMKGAKKQGQFEFIRFHATASFQDLKEKPAILLDESCPLSQ